MIRERIGRTGCRKRNLRPPCRIAVTNSTYIEVIGRLRRQASKSKSRSNRRVVPCYGIGIYHRTQSLDFREGFVFLRGRQRISGDNHLPHIRRRYIPVRGDRIRLYIQIHSGRRNTLRETLYTQLIDIVDGVLTHIHHIIPNDSDNTIRTTVVLEVRITHRITRCAKHEISYLMECVDIHRVGHHTQRSMRLRESGAPTEEELHLQRIQTFHHRQGNPRISTGGLIEEETARALIHIRRTQARIFRVITEDTQACRIISSTRTYSVSSGSGLKIKGERYVAFRSNRDERIAV